MRCRFVGGAPSSSAAAPGRSAHVLCVRCLTLSGDCHAVRCPSCGREAKGPPQRKARHMGGCGHAPGRARSTVHAFQMIFSHAHDRSVSLDVLQPETCSTRDSAKGADECGVGGLAFCFCGKEMHFTFRGRSLIRSAPAKPIHGTSTTICAREPRQIG